MFGSIFQNLDCAMEPAEVITISFGLLVMGSGRKRPLRQRSMITPGDGVPTRKYIQTYLRFSKLRINTSPSRIK